MALTAGAEAHFGQGPQRGAGIQLEACNPDLGEAKVYLVPFAGLPLAFLETVLLA